MLAGCGKADAAAIHERLTAFPGVVDTTTECTKSLPLGYSCTVMVTVANDISADELVAVLPELRDHIGGAQPSIVSRATGASSASGRIQFDPQGRFNSGVSDRDLAETFVDGIADPDVAVFALEANYPPAGPTVIVGYGADKEPAAFGESDWAEEADRRASALASAREAADAVAADEIQVATPTLDLHVLDGAFPEVGVALAEALAREFRVALTQIGPGVVVAQVVSADDVEAAQAFAKTRPEYATLTLVQIDDSTAVPIKDIAYPSSAHVAAVLAAARDLPGYTSVSEKYGTVHFVVESPEDAIAIDAAMRGTPAYARVGAKFTGPGINIERGPGDFVGFDVFVALFGDPRIDQLSIEPPGEQWEDLTLRVDVVTVGETPYDIGFLLASVGIAELPDTWVNVRIIDEPNPTLNMNFNAAPDVEPWEKADKQLVAEFQAGWTDGRAAAASG